MKKLFISAILLFQVLELQAATIRKRAVIRDENFHAEIDEVVLPDLTSDEAYEGKYFKIVLGKSDQAVRFDESEDLQLKAATTYFHLNKARKYFTDVIKSSYVQNLPQLTIRLDLINVFNELGHFAHDNLDPQFNNALTIPAGAGYEPKGIKPWNMEIWFRPSKEIHIKDFKGTVDSVSVKGSLVSFRNQTHMSNLDQFISTILYGGKVVALDSMMRLAGSSVIIEAIYQTTDIAAEFFSRKIYRLDSALVPEIIYHEFAHVALSDHLELTHSTPVNEGFADFFAGKIANSKKLATKINDYNLFNGKQVKRKQQYNIAFERGDFANSDFVFGLLWNVGTVVGADIESTFVYSMTRKVETNDSIRDGLITSSLEACKEICKNQLGDRIKLYKFYHSKNL